MSETQNLAIAVSSANSNLTKPSLIRDSVLLNNTTKNNMHKRHWKRNINVSELEKV